MAGTDVTYGVDVAWGDSVEGLFRIGVSTIGGTDTIGGWPADGAFESVVADVVAFSVIRGRSDDLGQLMAGTAEVVLRDQSGTYNPVNTGSALSPNVKPMRPIRVQATYDGTTYGLFYGFILSIESRANPNHPITTFSCADLFSWLAMRYPTISATGSTTTGAAIKAVLDEISWPTSLQSLDTGDTIPDFSADGTVSSLQLIHNLMDAEMGTFYVDGSGIATFDERFSRWATAASSSTITGADNTLMGWDSTNSVDTIFNATTVTRTGGSAQSDSDSDSISTFGRRDMAALETAYLATDAEALSRARLRVKQYKDPKTPAVATLRSASSTTADMLARELNQRVTITETFGGTAAKQYWIEQINHMSDVADQNQHQTRWLLSEVPSTGPFIIGVSAIGEAWIGA
jgi:hypothetical protein